LKYIVKIDGESLEVEVKETARKGTERVLKVEVGGREFSISVQSPPEQREAPPMYAVDTAAIPAAAPQPNEKRNAVKSEGDQSGVSITSPMTGKIVSVNVKPNSKISRGDVLFILEARKMENSIASTAAGVVKTVRVSVGDVVRTGDLLCLIAPEE